MRTLHDLSPASPQINYWITAMGDRLPVTSLTDTHIANIMRRRWSQHPLRQAMYNAVIEEYARRQRDAHR